MDDMDCMYCGDKVNTESKDTYTEVIGFTHPRSGGGPNTISLRRPTGHFACNVCVMLKKAGVSPDQGNLFD